MSLFLRRWRHKLSPAARRGREATRRYTEWMAKQEELKARDAAATPEKP
jgi:hypothetical protein